ncbi:MAG: hypothetical protein R8G60_09645 [Roseovarius pacificus]|nr:hypothetical protein [Roseovarius pacificus]
MRIYDDEVMTLLVMQDERMLADKNGLTLKPKITREVGETF